MTIEKLAVCCLMCIVLVNHKNLNIHNLRLTTVTVYLHSDIFIFNLHSTMCDTSRIKSLTTPSLRLNTVVRGLINQANNKLAMIPKSCFTIWCKRNALKTSNTLKTNITKSELMTDAEPQTAKFNQKCRKDKHNVVYTEVDLQTLLNHKTKPFQKSKFDRKTCTWRYVWYVWSKTFLCTWNKCYAVSTIEYYVRQ